MYDTTRAIVLIESTVFRLQMRVKLKRGQFLERARRQRKKIKFGRYLDNENRNFQGCLNGTLKTRGRYMPVITFTR